MHEFLSVFVAATKKSILYARACTIIIILCLSVVYMRCSDVTLRSIKLRHHIGGIIMRTKNESELRKSGNSFAQVVRRPRVSTARPPPLHLTTSKVMVIVWRN